MDRVVTSKVLDMQGSKPGTYVATKRLLLKSAMAKLKSLEGQLRQEHYFMTLPWGDNGYRILTSAGYFDYNSKMSKLMSEFNAAKQEFIDAYPQHLIDAKAALNGSFDANEYPPVHKIEDKLGVYVSVDSVTTAEDFRVDLGDAATALIKQQMVKEGEQRVQDAIKDVYLRLAQVVSHAVERLRAYNEDAEGKITGQFRDSTIQNIKDMVDLVPVLNITNDPQLTAFAETINKEIATQYPGELRADETVRVKVADKAEAILKQMAAYFG